MTRVTFGALFLHIATFPETVVRDGWYCHTNRDRVVYSSRHRLFKAPPSSVHRSKKRHGHVSGGTGRGRWRRSTFQGLKLPLRPHKSKAVRDPVRFHTFHASTMPCAIVRVYNAPYNDGLQNAFAYLCVVESEGTNYQMKGPFGFPT